jgi:hypothetical protein
VWLALVVVPAWIVLMLTRTIRTDMDGSSKKACINNVKQLALGCVVYSIDHDDLMPPAATWVDSIRSTLHDEGHEDLFGLACGDAVWTGPPRQKPIGYGYAMNRFLDRASTANLEEPASMHLIYDSSNLSRNANEYLPAFPDPPRHHGYVVVGFADGHAKAVKAGR